MLPNVFALSLSVRYCSKKLPVYLFVPRRVTNFRLRRR